MGIFYAFISAFFGAMATIVYKPMMQAGVSPLSISLIECIMAISLVFFFTKYWRLAPFGLEDRKVIFWGGLTHGLGAISFICGLYFLDPVTFSFLGRNQTTVAIILGYFLLGERHPPLIWIFIGLALIGSLLLSCTEFNCQRPIGLLFMLVFCISFATRGLLLRRHPHIPLFTNIFYGYVFVLLFNLIIAALSTEISLTLPSYKQTLTLAVASVFIIGGSMIFYMKALAIEALSLVSSIRLFGPYFVMLYFVGFADLELARSKIVGIILMTISLLVFCYQQWLVPRRLPSNQASSSLGG